jgi:hypothetical protein
MLPRMWMPLLAGLAWSIPAPAAVYRCDEGGRVTYTDRACAAHAAAFVPRTTLNVFGHGPSRDLLGDYKARSEREQAENQKADQAWLRAYQERRTREDALWHEQVQLPTRRKDMPIRAKAPQRRGKHRK